MPGTLTIRFTPTEKDYGQAAQALLFTQPPGWLLAGITALFEIYLLASAFRTPSPRPLTTWLLTILPVVMLWGAWALIPAQVRRAARGNERILAKMTWELTDTGIAMRNSFGETVVGWGSLARLGETRDYFFLQYRTRKQFHHFVPKRALPAPAQQAEFREYVTRHITAARR